MRDQIVMMEEAGFGNVEHKGFSNIQTSEYTKGALFKAIKK